MAKLADVLKQATVTLKVGDYLAAFTRPEGYVPSIKGTTSLHTGKYLFKIVGVGTAEADGSYKKMNIVPVVKKADGKSFEDKLKSPIVIVEPLKVTHATGRNDAEYKDVYHGNSYHTHTVKAGAEGRSALLAFLEFTKTEYSLTVNDFMVGGEELIAGA